MNSKVRIGSNHVEFHHNGKIDSLTGVTAQPIFFDSLRRSISRAARLEAEITIVTIKFAGVSKVETSASEVKALEGRLIQMARAIKSSLRGEDFFTRMSERGFWICVSGDKVAAVSAQKRFISAIGSQLDSKYTSASKSEMGVTSSVHTKIEIFSLPQWITEIDESYFN